jgi:membrane-associated phospholipid phosphatase
VSKALKVSKKITGSFPVKSLLLLAICFSSIKPAALAQKTSLDQQVLISLMNHRTDGGSRFCQGISNSTQLVSTLIPVSVLAAGLISNDFATLKKGLYIATTVAGSAFITYALKNSFKRERPYDAHPGIIPVGGGSSSPSFPSGHTSMAFSSATSLTIAYPKWYIAAPAFVWAASVGYSRMYMGVHYPSDVLAGAVVGAGSAWLMHKANKWLFRKTEARRQIF